MQKKFSFCEAVNITLQKFTREDFPTLIGWIHTGEFMQQWCGGTFKFPLDESQLENYINGAEETPPVRYVYKSVDSDTDSHVGNITLEFKNNIERAAAITCVIVDEKYRGEGIASFMIRDVLNTAFRELDYESVYLNVFNFNKSAIKCYESAGFSKAAENIAEFSCKKAVNHLMIIRKGEWEEGVNRKNKTL
jgi:RimJ/RimL family protein N-acetyltransferase